MLEHGQPFEAHQVILEANNAPRKARLGPFRTSSLVRLPPPALEPQTCERKGLGPLMAASTKTVLSRNIPGNVAQLSELVTRLIPTQRRYHGRSPSTGKTDFPGRKCGEL